MNEQNIFLNSGELRLEGLLYNLPGDKGVIVSHPHPLYGGDMYNNVVEALCKAYKENGYSTLRFNFRGAGRSDGVFDDGNGEQDDVEAALAYLYGLGKRDLDLAGYSFGSWVNALGLNRYKEIKRMIMISPPVDLLDFSALGYSSKIKLIICGDKDDVANWRSVEKAIPTWNPEAVLKVIQGADHFYWGKTTELKEILNDFLMHN